MKSAKRFVLLRSQPAIGDLVTLETARVAAPHDSRSVIVSVTDGPTVRLTEIDAKSLKMKIPAKIDEDDVWQVVAIDEAPPDANRETLKAARLIVLKPVDQSELEKHRTTYEAGRKPEKPEE